MAEDLAGLLAAGERAAFHGRPSAGVAPLQQAVEVGARRGRDDEATAAAWLLGVSLGAAGRYGSALAVLEPLAERASGRAPGRAGCSPRSPRPPRRASTASSAGTRSPGPSTSEPVELAGDAAEALFDARLGLAADAVGLGEAGAGPGALDRAAALPEGRADWWRQRVRLLWVRAEVALLVGDPGAAAKAADGAVTLAEGVAGAPARGQEPAVPRGRPRCRAASRTRPSRRCAGRRRWPSRWAACPLLWPSRALLGALLEGQAPAGERRALASARNAVLTSPTTCPRRCATSGWPGPTSPPCSAG